MTLCAVWQHLDDDDRAIAFKHLAEMTTHGGLLIMSLHHGIGLPIRRFFPICVEAAIDSARREGFRVVRAAEAGSMQACNHAAGVHWTGLALRRVR